jgi:tetratricopeptide (TPR) repeat protein
MTTRPHAFVAMPFGVKPGVDGEPIDFNRVYGEYIAPALEAAGLEAFRADEEIRAGDIRTDMFQELLVADLVIADLSIDNPNVWYELGVRHALRARGVVLVSGGRVPAAFDLYTDRKVRYGLKHGGPDPATIEDDKRKLTEMVKATMESWHGRKVSPVYNLMPNLQEPDWKSLRIGDVREFWEQHRIWENRLDLARKAGKIGDVLVLAEEAPVAAFRADAWIKAGESLRKAERFRFALEHLEHGLEIEPENLRALREKGICLQRLAIAGLPDHSLDRARDHYREVLKLYPNDPETWALLGRVDKDAWVDAWRRAGQLPAQMRKDAAYEDALLRAAIHSYVRAYHANPGHYYSGINALTLMHLAKDLTNDARYDREIANSAGAVRFAADCEPDERQLFWSKTTLGDLEVLIGTADTVETAFKEAIAKSERDWFALNSSLAQLLLLQDLGFRPNTVAAGIATFVRALERLKKPDDRWQPRHVLLFSGHMMDAPKRKTPRFPPDKENVAAQAIGAVLDQLGTSSEDLAFSQAAAGGDLLFIDACQNRGVRCRVLLPLIEPEFIERSILPSAGGENWRDRFYAMRSKLMEPIRIMPDELGPLPKGVDPFERCNLWLLYSALACGIDKVRFVTLWNGGGGDGPGGTAHVQRGEGKDRSSDVAGYAEAMVTFPTGGDARIDHQIRIWRRAGN